MGFPEVTHTQRGSDTVVPGTNGCIPRVLGAPPLELEAAGRRRHRRYFSFTFSRENESRRLIWKNVGVREVTSVTGGPSECLPFACFR